MYKSTVVPFAYFLFQVPSKPQRYSSNMKQEYVTDLQNNGKDQSRCTNGHLPRQGQGQGQGRFSCPVSSLEPPYVSMLEYPQLFYKKLNEFHESSGLTLVSSAASSVLDLYIFFKEVILRGGFAQVTKDGRWHEIASALSFSSCSPQTSLMLQNIYANLLFQFELIFCSMPPGSQLEFSQNKRTSLGHPSSSGDTSTGRKDHPTSPDQSYKGSNLESAPAKTSSVDHPSNSEDIPTGKRSFPTSPGQSYKGSQLESDPIKRNSLENPSSSADIQTGRREHPTSPGQSYKGSELESAPIKRTSLEHPSSSGDIPTENREHPTSSHILYEGSQSESAPINIISLDHPSSSGDIPTGRREHRTSPHILHKGSQLESGPIKRTYVDNPSSFVDVPEKQGELPTSPGQSYEASDDPGNHVGKQVYGVIHNEIECGYLVSVMVGKEKLNGLLYHITDSTVKQFTGVPSLMGGVVMKDPDSEPVGSHVPDRHTDQELTSMPTTHSLSKGKKKMKQTVSLMSKDKVKGRPTLKSEAKKERKDKENKGYDTPITKSTSKKERKDKDAPLRRRSAYQLFLCKECDRLKQQHGKNPSTNTRQMAIDSWKSLSETERLPYIEESKKDKERFKREMIAYNERTSKKSNAAEFRIFNSEASMHEFHDYHAPIQIGQDSSMVGLVAKLMEGELELDAALKIELEDEFLSQI